MNVKVDELLPSAADCSENGRSRGSKSFPDYMRKQYGC